MEVDKINQAIVAFICLVCSIITVVVVFIASINNANANENEASTTTTEKRVIKPYEIPTFTGEKVNWEKITPAINKIKKVDADYLHKVVTNCYPIKPWGIELNLKSSVQYRMKLKNELTVASTSSPFYAGIVFNMPLYSGSEVSKMRNLEYKRRMDTAKTLSILISALSEKRRAERLMGLYLSLEKRSQERVRQGIVSVDEQIMYLEKVANTQANLDKANASIEGSRISLISQCRPEASEQVNNIILSEIKD